MGVFDDEDLLDQELLDQQQTEFNILLEKGIPFKTISGITLTLYPPFAGTLVHMSGQFNRLDINREALFSDNAGDVWDEQKRKLGYNLKIASKIVAIAVLNNPIKIWFFSWFYAKYILWKLKPNDIKKITGLIMKTAKLGDFSGSIVLLSTLNVLTPKAIEG